jgi:hypothetical protein
MKPFARRSNILTCHAGLGASRAYLGTVGKSLEPFNGGLHGRSTPENRLAHVPTAFPRGRTLPIRKWRPAPLVTKRRFRLTNLDVLGRYPHWAHLKYA